MPSLKDLKNRINSVKSTRKITKAMQMVAAAKLRRAQEAAESARPYAERMGVVLGNIASAAAASPEAPRLLTGTGADQVHLLVVATAERGLCGAFNSSIVKLARQKLLNHLDFVQLFFGQFQPPALFIDARAFLALLDHLGQDRRDVRVRDQAIAALAPLGDIAVFDRGIDQAQRRKPLRFSCPHRIF